MPHIERRLQEEEEARLRAEEEKRLEEERKKRELEEAKRREEEAKNRAAELERLTVEYEATRLDLEGKTLRLAEILRAQKEVRDVSSGRNPVYMHGVDAHGRVLCSGRSIWPVSRGRTRRWKAT